MSDLCPKCGAYWGCEHGVYVDPANGSVGIEITAEQIAELREWLPANEIGPARVAVYDLRDGC